MDPFEEFQKRVVEGIALPVVALIAATFANAFSRTAPTEDAVNHLLLTGLSNYGLIIIIITFVIATWRAGLIGSLGFTIEYLSTANIQNGEISIGLLFLGAIVVLIGRLVWSWPIFIELVFGGGGGRHSHY